MGINLINDNLVQANARSKWRVSSTYAYSSGANIDFDTVWTGFTNIGDWVNDGSGQITVPVDGVYDLICSVETSTGFWTADRALTVSVNGSIEAYLGSGNGVARSMKGTALLQLTKGDLLTFKINDNQSIEAAENQTYLSISRVADFTAGQPAGFGVATPDVYGLMKKQKSSYATSTYTATNLTNSTAVFGTDFDVINLVIGRKYRITATVGLINETGNLAAVYWYDGGRAAGNVRLSVAMNEISATQFIGMITKTSEFVATTTTLLPSWIGDNDGNNGINSSSLNSQPHTLIVTDITDEYEEGNFFA
jgi:hypothetical protein